MVRRRFAEDSSHDPLWERLVDAVQVQDENGWKRLNEFPLRRILLFFDSQEENSAFIFESTSILVDVIAECPGFEFYVTNEICSFVVCFNHHNCLIGCGEAKDWL